jgi:hypothetical protein
MVSEPSLWDDMEFDWEDGDSPPSLGTTPGLPVTLTDGLIPLDQEGLYIPNHLDAEGTVHFFAPVDISEEPNFDDPMAHLRYYRAIRADDGRLVYDSHPVMPLDGAPSPFPLPTLQLMLEDGDLENAQELAYQMARSHGLAFPELEALPSLNTGVDYAFEVGVGDDGDPTLEAVKRWRDGSQAREARQPIAMYGMSEEAARDQAELNDVRETNGLAAAMNLAERMAVAGGYLDPTRDDPRLFTDGPPDPFTSSAERNRTMAATAHDHRDDDAQTLTSEARAEPFRERFADSHYHLLEPVDPTVNYSFEVVAVDPWTLELAADKWWLAEDGRIGSQAQTLKTYPLESHEWEREIEREIAAMDREDLYRTYREEGLEAAMRQAAAMAAANDELDAERAGGRLFTEGPADRFTTAREAELLGLEAAPVGGPMRDITNDETAELPAVRVPDAGAPEPGSWDERVAQQRDHVDPEPERHYWQMHCRPVETPEGEPLGTALFVTEFPQLPPEFDDDVAENGMDDSLYPTKARTLEMAHFTSEDDARKFEMEFRSYLVPGLLEGPELAPEVAKLEGLSGTWEGMDYQGIVDYMSGERTVVREESDWHLHDPNAEREAQMAAAGSDTALDDSFSYVDDEPSPTPEASSPDLDL